MHFLPENPQPPNVPKIQRGQQKHRMGTSIQQTQDQLSIPKIYNHPKPGCLHASIKTQSATAKTMFPLESTYSTP